MGDAARSGDKILGRRYAAARGRRHADPLRRPFAGGTVLHWAQGAGGRGALLSGDIVQVLPNRNFVSFMRSYPNFLPLSAPAVERIGALLEPYAYEVIYGAWFDRVVPRDGEAIVRRSIARYLAAIRGDGSAELN